MGKGGNEVLHAEFKDIAEFKDDDMQLNNVKIPIFEDYIIRLVSIFLDWIELDNATGDIGHFMNQIYCTGLSMSNMELDRAYTKSLVQCLQNNIFSLELGRNGPVILDIDTLLEYSGKGKCSQMTFFFSKEFCETYIVKLRNWTKGVNWAVEKESYSIVFKRVSEEIRLIRSDSFTSNNSEHCSANDEKYEQSESIGMRKTFVPVKKIENGLRSLTGINPTAYKFENLKTLPPDHVFSDTINKMIEGTGPTKCQNKVDWAELWLKRRNDRITKVKKVNQSISIRDAFNKLSNEDLKKWIKIYKNKVDKQHNTSFTDLLFKKQDKAATFLGKTIYSKITIGAIINYTYYIHFEIINHIFLPFRWSFKNDKNIIQW